MSWYENAFFYHIYPLGLTGAPEQNDFTSPPEQRLQQLHSWIPHLQYLGITAVYLGPVFESSAHGYDTADYFRVDRRLGTADDLKELCAAFHSAGMKVVFDGVFNHVGRNFWAFQDLLEKGRASRYVDWFQGVDFTRTSPYGDPFSYDGWNGCYDLVKINIRNEEARQHLLDAALFWIDEFQIDGIRLDAADQIRLDFFEDLRAATEGKKKDFWLLGEIIHGDYRTWAKEGLLHSVTNYECYKGLYSSLNDKNYHEIAWSLNRQFGPEGIYRDQKLYSFADNHDVDRVASTLSEQAYLYPLYLLMCTMPGLPSIYYGSEWGMKGRKIGDSDAPLRPALPDPDAGGRKGSAPELAEAIKTFGDLYKTRKSLRLGSYQQLHVDSQQFAFSRTYEDEQIIVVLNSAEEPLELELAVDGQFTGTASDLLEPGTRFSVQSGSVTVGPVYPRWGRVLLLEG